AAGHRADDHDNDTSDRAGDQRGDPDSDRDHAVGLRTGSPSVDACGSTRRAATPGCHRPSQTDAVLSTECAWRLSSASNFWRLRLRTAVAMAFIAVDAMSAATFTAVVTPVATT